MRMHHPGHPGTLIADILENGARPALSRVINGKAAVSAEMALRLQDALGVQADLWLRLQAQRDPWAASQKKRVKVARVVVKEAAWRFPLRGEDLFARRQRVTGPLL